MRFFVLFVVVFFSFTCHCSNLKDEVFKAIASYESIKRYKRNTLKEIRKITGKYEQAIVLLGYYQNASSGHVYLNQKFNSDKNSSFFVNIEYNKNNNDTTLKLIKVIYL